MRLALGTVQFGLRYGVANASGPVADTDAIAILGEARMAGIDTLDTAIAYGNSEQRLGSLGTEGWRLISKLPPLPDGINDVENWVMAQLRDSLQRLRVLRLDGLLLHRPADLLGPYGQTYARALRLAREEGLVTALGYSIYSPDELLPLLEVFRPDIIQAPFNVIDRRLLTSGWMSRLADQGVRIHTRSAFLQGLLLLPEASQPAWFEPWRPLLQSWARACEDLGQSCLTVALAYVLSHPEIERVVVGVDNVAQLRQVIAAARHPVAGGFPDVGSQDLELIEPSRWKLQ